jgi:hypothetical protein
MRELTIKREKVSTCGRAAVEIYITSPEAAELTIEGVPCRKLGEVKNGEAEIFSIGGDEATVYAVVADSAKDFVCDIVSGFTGRLIDVPIPENIERFKAVWTPLAERAADKGVRIAWENCHMGGNWLTGDWNIAHNPDAW